MGGETKVKMLKSNALLNLEDEVQIRKLKGEIETFQRPLKNAAGRLPKKFEYPKHITDRVVALKSCGLNSRALAFALGLSRPSVDNWFKSKAQKNLTSKPLAKARELVIRDIPVPQACFDSARILFRTGIIMEIGSEAITQSLIRCLNGETTRDVGSR